MRPLPRCASFADFTRDSKGTTNEVLPSHRQFGSDKPDVRFDLEIADVSGRLPEWTDGSGLNVEVIRIKHAPGSFACVCVLFIVLACHLV